MERTSDFQIRSAREQDRSQLAAMWIDFLNEQTGSDPRFTVADDALSRWQNDFPEWVGSVVHGLFVAETREDGLVGFASVNLWYPAPIYEPEMEAYLSELYVTVDWRRRGVGTALLSEVRNWAKAKKAYRIRLGVLSANESAMAFWEGCAATPFVATLLIET